MFAFDDERWHEAQNVARCAVDDEAFLQAGINDGAAIAVQFEAEQQAQAAQVGTQGEKALPAEARASLTLARHQAGYLQEKHRQREQMERWRESSVPGSPPFMDELWSWGLSLLWRTIRRLW